MEQYVDAWKTGSAVIQKLPGARGTRLHRKIGYDNVLLAIADWESKEARDAAMEALGRADAATREITQKHQAYGELTKIGAFDETEWVVMP